MIRANAFQISVQKSKVEIFTPSINAINYAIKKHLNSDIEITLKGKKSFNLLSKLPSKYHSYANIFLVSESDKLSTHWNCNHMINLELETKPDHRSSY